MGKTRVCDCQENDTDDPLAHDHEPRTQEPELHEHLHAHSCYLLHSITAIYMTENMTLLFDQETVHA